MNARNTEKKSPQQQRSHAGRSHAGPSYDHTRYGEEPAYSHNQDKHIAEGSDNKNTNTAGIYDIEMENIDNIDINDTKADLNEGNDDDTNSRFAGKGIMKSGSNEPYDMRQYESGNLREYDDRMERNSFARHYPGAGRLDNLLQDNDSGRNEGVDDGDEVVDDRRDEEFRKYLESVKDPEIVDEIADDDAPLTSKFKVRFID